MTRVMTILRACVIFCQKASLNAEIAENAERAEKQGGRRFARSALIRFLRFSAISAISAFSALRLADAVVSTNQPNGAKPFGQRA